MSSITLISARDQRSSPWKNGGGVTTEIAIHPPASSLDTFEWRVSRAQVAHDGPFSSFPDVDRTLVVVSGRGLMLEVAGSPPRLLTTDTAPFPFAADVPTASRLLDGPVADINVMTRRGMWCHSVERHLLHERALRLPQSQVGLIYAVRGDFEVVAANGTVRGGPGDAVVSNGEPISVAAADDCLLLHVRLWRP